MNYEDMELSFEEQPEGLEEEQEEEGDGEVRGHGHLS